MSLILKASSTCPNCRSNFETDLPALMSAHGGGFYADLQPGYSAPAMAIWEAQLYSCPECGYTTPWPCSPYDPHLSDDVSNFVRITLTSFVKRQHATLNAQPSLTSKFELYALQLDFQRAEDHLIADQFLRASWSGRIRGRTIETRRLRSLAASHYEKALRTTAKDVIEEEIIVRYLLVELYRLLGEDGRRISALEQLLPFRGESMQGDVLVNVAERQFREPQEDVAIRAQAGLMDYLSTYRAEALVSHGYVSLRNNDLDRAITMFHRVLNFCEGPLRTRLQRGQGDLTMNIYSPMDGFGAQAAVGLREAYHRYGSGASSTLHSLESLIRLMETKWNVLADEICRQNERNYQLPSKSGWRYINRRTKDREPVAFSFSFGDKHKAIAKDVKELLNRSLEYCEQSRYDLAGKQAQEAFEICSAEIEGLDNGSDTYLELAQLRIKAHAIVAMSQLIHPNQTEGSIQYIEEALREYHVIGGSKTNAIFAFLLSMLAVAYERKNDFSLAKEAKMKAAELVEGDSIAVFHWGRQLYEFPLTKSVSEPILHQALIDDTSAKTWVEGAALFLLAQLYSEEGRTKEAFDAIRQAVLNNHMHVLDLWGYGFINKYLPDVLQWAESHYNSQAGRSQLRPTWQFGRTLGSFTCKGCNRSLPHKPSEKILTFDPHSMHDWLETGKPFGLACKKCGIFGACCWIWHIYYGWTHLDEPTYVPLCPKCGNILSGEPVME